MIMNKNYTVMELSSQPIPVVELPTPAPTSAPTSAPTLAPTPYEKYITSSDDCSAAGGGNYAYCEDTGKHYCCGVKSGTGYAACNGTDGACPSNSGLQDCVCPPYESNSSTLPNYPAQSYTIEGYITPNQIIAKPGLTINNFVCKSATFAGSASPNVTGDNLKITLYQQTNISSSWLFYIWSSPYTKMMLVEFAPTSNPYEIIVNNFYTADVESKATESSSDAISAWNSTSPTNHSGLYVTEGYGYIVKNLEITINNPTSNALIPTIPQPSSNNSSSHTVSGNLGGDSTLSLTGLTIDNVVCLSATFGGGESGKQNGDDLGIISYSQTSTSSSWLFYIWNSPSYTKMILVQFVPNGDNSIEVNNISAGYVMYDATVSETALKNAWNSRVSVSVSTSGYTVNDLKISTSSTESFESFFDSYPSTYSYFNESYYDDNIDRYQFI